MRSLQNCFIFTSFRGLQQHINVTIKLTTSDKMMVSAVLNRHSIEGEISQQLVKEADSIKILSVDIAVTSDEDDSIWVKLTKFLDTDSEGGKFRDKLRVLTMCWEIQNNMNGYLSFW